MARGKEKSNSKVENCLHTAMSLIEKIILKGTSKISLHERFTTLRHTIEREEAREKPTSSRPSYRDTREERDRDVRPRAPRELTSRPGARRTYGQKDWGPATSIVAAMKLKRRSVQQRLGVRSRIQHNRDDYQFSRPSYRGYGYGTNRARMRDDSDSEQLDWGMRRWGSDRSLDSDGGGAPHRRRWGNYRGRGWGRRNPPGHFRGWGGGNRKYRGSWGNRGYRNRNRGWGGGYRGRSRGGWGGRNRRNNDPPPCREDLDKELDEYMAGAKSVLDKELDDYAAQSKV